ncbi:DUF2326 domain-containing protein [Clostridium botulinum]|uniref:DUF2326 domain-containing protein n=1 Tax=Clostridium botulinum TaxID=1491 RepID=UPI001967C410|nr:DUF2326 domain-containing protein [Clostridium botulinum]MBN1077744.1 DUF2326 domain-containing protein [Clostridium botulinum]
MKLMQLYCNDDRFKKIKFSSGFNLIVGKITDEKNLNKDCHNLGKSTLIELIDFMLLKELKKGNFLKNNKFKNHTFFLELEINPNKYVTIRRSISKNTKISFKISDIPYQNYTTEQVWDYKDLPLKSVESDKNPKLILNNLLEFNILRNYNYRNYLNYFLRTQYDYSDEFHLSKFAGSDSNWKPQLFELLGFNKNDIENKYKLDVDYNKKNAYIENLENSLQIDPKQVDKIKGLIQIKEKEKQKVESDLLKFNFFLNEKNIDKKLVDEIEQEISDLNTQRYKLEMDIKNLSSSIKNDVSFDIKATLEIFKEVKIYFSDQLKKSYEELLNFNKTLTTDRNKYIVETLSSKESQLKKIESELILLDSKRKEMLEILTETDTFKKYKSLEKELIKIERDLEKYASKLEDSAIIEKEIDDLSKIYKSIETFKKKIKLQIDSENETYTSIRNSFSEYVKDILDKPGLLSISQNSVGNIEFKSEIVNEDNESTEQSKGHSYRKILCACFDLAILTNYSTKSFFKFVYHDGCLETLDPRKKKNYLDLIQKLCSEHNIQYILTLIESDLPLLDSKKYVLDDTCNVAVELSDLDDTTNLFGFTF